MRIDGDAVRAALANALALAFPVACAGCRAPGRALCDACRGQLEPEPRCRRLPSGLAVWSGLDYHDVAAGAVRALKEEGRTALARDLAPALRAALLAAAGDSAALIAVPVPATRAAMRRRGYVVVDLLARRAGVGVRHLLVPVARTADQRTLGRDARRLNVAGSMRARSASGLRIVLVDDVVTTGATLEEAARALAAAGASVVAAATVAATALRSSSEATRR